MQQSQSNTNNRARKKAETANRGQWTLNIRKKLKPGNGLPKKKQEEEERK